jgi:magnesium-protoporphyrin IX monomethyl ester (oxidative) cyclase
MRTDPKLTSGVNVWWIKFFLLAVFATMYVRDHARPAFHRALGVDITEYDMKVFHLTSEISRQVFPIVLDLDHPAFIRCLKRLERINRRLSAAHERGGIAGRLAKGWWMARAGMVFARLYAIPTKRNQVPETSRLQPVW